jgi:hypothetical protein
MAYSTLRTRKKPLAGTLLALRKFVYSTCRSLPILRVALRHPGMRTFAIRTAKLLSVLHQAIQVNAIQPKAIA